MEQNSEMDYLHFKGDPEIETIIDGEEISFSDSLQKKNTWGFYQLRNFIITNKALYNLDKKVLKRRFPLEKIIGLTVSSVSDEFVIHCDDIEYDYLLNSMKKKKIIEHLATLYYKATSNEIKIFLIDKSSLKEYVTTKKEKKKNNSFSRMPLTGAITPGVYLYGEKAEVGVSKMGVQITQTDKIYSDKNISINNFELLKVIGRGSVGKIYLVKYKVSDELYAIKSMRKDQLVSEQITENILLEKQTLSKSECPFILTLSFFFQTSRRIYFVTPYLKGGDLYTYLRKLKAEKMAENTKENLDEKTVKFYASQVAIGLQHLHDYGTAYRDLKPENILIDADGYLKLCDFGASIHFTGNEKKTELSGSPEYVSPEMVSGNGHDLTTDWWSLGILIFELLFGYAPFWSDNRERLYEIIQWGEIKFPSDIKVSPEAYDVIERLLDKDPNTRLGNKGLDEIKSHPFFCTMNFDEIRNKKLKPPYIPSIKDKEDTSNFDQEFKDMPLTESPVDPWVEEYQDWFTEFNIQDGEENEDLE